MLYHYLGLSRGEKFLRDTICPKMGRVPPGEPDL